MHNQASVFFEYAKSILKWKGLCQKKISVERKLSNVSLDEVVIEKNHMVKDLGGALGVYIFEII